jgi:hypothetical protein
LNIHGGNRQRLFNVREPTDLDRWRGESVAHRGCRFLSLGS